MNTIKQLTAIVAFTASLHGNATWDTESPLMQVNHTINTKNRIQETADNVDRIVSETKEDTIETNQEESIWSGVILYGTWEQRALVKSHLSEEILENIGKKNATDVHIIPMVSQSWDIVLKVDSYMSDGNSKINYFKILENTPEDITYKEWTTYLYE